MMPIRVIIYSIGIVMAIVKGPGEPTLLRGLFVHLLLPIAFLELLLWCFFTLIHFVSVPRTSRGVLGHHSITLTPDGITETTAVNNTSYSWLAISKIFESKEFIFLQVTPGMVHMIPKRAFSDPQLSSEFLESARSMKSGYVLSEEAAERSESGGPERAPAGF